jgi:uncharacterized protein YceK
MLGRKFIKEVVLVGAFCLGIGLAGCATVSGGTPPAEPAGQHTDATRQIETAVNGAGRVYGVVNRARWMVEDMRRWGG